MGYVSAGLREFGHGTVSNILMYRRYWRARKTDSMLAGFLTYFTNTVNGSGEKAGSHWRDARRRWD